MNPAAYFETQWDVFCARCAGGKTNEINRSSPTLVCDYCGERIPAQEPRELNAYDREVAQILGRPKGD